MQFTAQIIAQHLGGIVEGNAEVTVSDFSKIDEGRPGTITFLSNPQYTRYIYDTQASIVIVRKDFVAEQPVAATLIRVENPYVALSSLLSLVSQYIKPEPKGIEMPCRIAEGVEISDDCYVGAFAYIGAGAQIGNRVKIYPQVYVGPGVIIGDDTTLYPGVKVYYNCRIGNRCTIHSGAVIGADGFGFAPDAQGVFHKIEQIGNVIIEDDVEIGANTTIDRSTMGSTRIGHGVKLDNLIQVGHNCEVGHDTVMAAQAGVAGSCKVGSNCIVGGQAGLSGHITIGDRTTIGPQTGVPKDTPAGSRIMGSPAMPWGEFGRMAALLKRLPDIAKTVARLEKENSKE
ncbi:MAG: UDP-3-O-(3-hydroxymyristoyl)glucosamine N-acyltransferase [Muribaculaceae bacterium]|nr:UDP-3-O-(3-hydroxymyristoyl)glucosamine N-acyltransferase [Muribaculaceae bacterium]